MKGPVDMTDDDDGGWSDEQQRQPRGSRCSDLVPFVYSGPPGKIVKENCLARISSVVGDSTAGTFR